MDEALILIDKLLPYYPDFDSFDPLWCDQSKWTEKDKNSLVYNQERVIKLLLRMDYVTEDEYNHVFELTDKGRNAKKAGGHFAYLQQISDKAAIEAERQKLNDEKLRLDVKNSRRIFKTY